MQRRLNRSGCGVQGGWKQDSRQREDRRSRERVFEKKIFRMERKIASYVKDSRLMRLDLPIPVSLEGVQQDLHIGSGTSPTWYSLRYCDILVIMLLIHIPAFSAQKATTML